MCQSEVCRIRILTRYGGPPTSLQRRAANPCHTTGKGLPVPVAPDRKPLHSAVTATANPQCAAATASPCDGRSCSFVPRTISAAITDAATMKIEATINVQPYASVSWSGVTSACE